MGLSTSTVNDEVFGTYPRQAFILMNYNGTNVGEAAGLGIGGYSILIVSGNQVTQPDNFYLLRFGRGGFAEAVFYSDVKNTATLTNLKNFYKLKYPSIY